MLNARIQSCRHRRTVFCRARAHTAATNRQANKSISLTCKDTIDFVCHSKKRHFFRSFLKRCFESVLYVSRNLSGTGTMEVAPLIPRGTNNKSKKKRPGFRPVGKSNAKTSTSSAEAATTATLQQPGAGSLSTEGVTAAEDNNIHGESKDSSQLDVALCPTTEASQTTPAKAGTRKRKQSTNISIGLTVRKSQPIAPATHEAQSTRQRKITRSIAEATTVSPATQAAEVSSVPTDDTSFPSRSFPRGSKARVVVTNTPAPTVSFPADGHLLQRLASENPDGVRLGTFCSAFKGKKQPRTKKGTGANAAPRANGTSNNAISRGNINASTSNSNTNSMAPNMTGAPVVKIVDGEIVLQESSLLVPGQRRTVQEVEEEFQDVVEEDAQMAVVGASYNSFINRKGPQHWTIKDTKRFFEALRQMGTDFCSMEAFFENRTRKQLKRKYRQEMIRNPALVELALDPRNKTQVGTYNQYSRYSGF